MHRPRGRRARLCSIHEALVPGGRLVDTQPVSPRPRVETDVLGRLDMTEWARTIATVDVCIERTIHDGLFELAAERRFIVIDEYDDGAEFVTVTREWAGTRVDDALAELVGAQAHTVCLHQEVRLRLLLARGPRAPT
jgi:hypothetical protein